jgi:hypothetical protein
MNTAARELHALGNALELAARRDLARASGSAARRRKIVAVAVGLAIAVPGLAYAATALIGAEEVAAGLPGGTRMLQGTEPRCTVVHQDVEYHCVLSRLPAEPEVADLKGTVEPTVDRTRQVNGGCRSLTSDGRAWQCYIGRAAVEQKIVSADFLGEYMPTPGVG